jgi:5-(carboxyamino)imidazole ribonucleotide mutase
MDSLLSIVQMPGGVPVATMAIGKAGAINAALFAARILATKHERFRAPLSAFIAEQEEQVLKNPDPSS